MEQFYTQRRRGRNHVERKLSELVLPDINKRTTVNSINN